MKYMVNVHEAKDGLLIDLFVKTNCTKFGLKIEGEELMVYSTEEPTKGKVNREIVKELTRLLKHQVQIVAGLTSRRKKILIENCGKKDFEMFLENFDSSAVS